MKTNEFEYVLKQSLSMHKEMIELAGKRFGVVKKENEFQIISTALCMTLACLLKIYGVDEVEKYLKDFSEQTKNFLQIEKSSYMLFKDGVKIADGKIN